MFYDKSLKDSADSRDACAKFQNPQTMYIYRQTVDLYLLTIYVCHMCVSYGMRLRNMLLFVVVVLSVPSNMWANSKSVSSSF